MLLKSKAHLNFEIEAEVSELVPPRCHLVYFARETWVGRKKLIQTFAERLGTLLEKQVSSRLQVEKMRRNLHFLKQVEAEGFGMTRHIDLQ